VTISHCPNWTTLVLCISNDVMEILFTGWTKYLSCSPISCYFHRARDRIPILLFLLVPFQQQQEQQQGKQQPSP
jgi:hypothetical protein